MAQKGDAGNSTIAWVKTCVRQVNNKCIDRDEGESKLLFLRQMRDQFQQLKAKKM